jgi:hypothetical protein
MRDFDDSTLWRISAYERMRQQTGDSGFARLNGASVLATTLTAELNHLQRGYRGGEVLDVVAACMRQRESALILLRLRDLVWPLTLFPQQGLYHLTRPIIDELESGNADLEVISVEPPGLRPPGHVMKERIAEHDKYRTLRPLLWALAMHTPRTRLLDELGGRAAFRLAAEYEPDASTLTGAMGTSLRRLRQEIAALTDIARWPGMDRERATRLLNGVYLQGGLMVLRTHHAARESATSAERLRIWLRPPGGR